MTTIAYNHKDKQIAVDSRTTCNNVIVNDKANKIYLLDGVRFVFTGKVPDIEEFVATYPNIDESRKLECWGVMIDKDVVYDVGIDKDGKFSKCVLNYSDAFGSGNEFAIAAMDFGKTAKEAIEYAMTRDNKTGGKVTVIDL